MLTYTNTLTHAQRIHACIPQKVRGLTFRNKLQAYTNTKRLPQFQDQFMLIPENRTFNWPFLLVRRNGIHLSVSTSRPHRHPHSD